MKHISTYLLAISILFLSACNKKPEVIDYKKLNRESSIKHIKEKFEQNKSLKKYTAVSYTIDNDGRSAIGYAYHAKTQKDADMMAIKQCTRAKESANLTSNCKIYAEGNKIIQEIQ